MIQLEINNESYICIESWEEMTLQNAIDLHKVCHSMPAKLKQYFELLSTQNEIELTKYISELTEEETEKEFPSFYGKVIGQLTNIPCEVIEKLNGSYRNIFYKKYCEIFVYGIIQNPYNYVCRENESFLHKGIEFFLPQTKTILGQEKPFFDRSAIEFTEASDLQTYSANLTGGKFEVAPNIISILARPKGEKYNEQICIDRAKEFLSLSMDKVFDVFFCFQKHIDTSKKHTKDYLVEEERKVLKHIERAV